MTSASRTTPTRVVLVDDQELVRRGFAALIEAEPGVTVVGEAADGSSAIDVVHSTGPDVVMMDIRMPKLDGIEATRRITADRRLASTRIIMLTTFDLDRYVYSALRAGASGFLLKDTPPARLLDAIDTVATGEALLAPKVTARLIEQFAARPVPGAHQHVLGPLTDRERDVLIQVGRGRTNAEIGAELLISPLTAKTHVSRILSKLGLRDRAQMVVTAYETGLITPGEPIDPAERTREAQSQAPN